MRTSAGWSETRIERRSEPGRAGSASAGSGRERAGRQRPAAAGRDHRSRSSRSGSRTSKASLAPSAVRSTPMRKITSSQRERRRRRRRAASAPTPGTRRAAARSAFQSNDCFAGALERRRPRRAPRPRRRRPRLRRPGRCAAARKRSPGRTKRGSAGWTITGRRTAIWPTAKPKRSRPARPPWRGS